MNKGEIFLVGMPSSNGHEQSGTRPAIIFSNPTQNTIITIPLTTQLFYANYENTLKINSSKENGLDLDSVALAYQIRVIDIKRIKNKIGKLDSNTLNKLNNLVRLLLIIK